MYIRQSSIKKPPRVDGGYRIWLGTYWQSECAGATDEDDTYIAELQKYITQNLGQQSH